MPPLAGILRWAQSYPVNRMEHKASQSVCHLGDSEAASQHLEAYNSTIGDSEYDRDVRIADSLELERDRVKYNCSIVAGQNVVDLKALGWPDWVFETFLFESKHHG
jgi:hypothetical protein